MISANLINTLVIIATLILVILILIIYFRSRQGDQRVINTTRFMLLPILGAIVFAINIVFSNHQNSYGCTGILTILIYIGGSLAVFFPMLGTIRYFLNQRRDIRQVLHPVLFSVIIISIVFLIENMGGCL